MDVAWMHLNLFPQDDENNLMNFYFLLEFVQFILQANNAIFVVFIAIGTIKKSHTRGYWDNASKEETPKIVQNKSARENLRVWRQFCLLSLKPPMQISMNDHHYYRSTILLKDDTQCDIGTHSTNM